MWEIKCNCSWTWTPVSSYKVLITSKKNVIAFCFGTRLFVAFQFRFGFVWMSIVHAWFNGSDDVVLIKWDVSKFTK